MADVRLCLLILSLLLPAWPGAAADANVTITVTGENTDAPMPCRIHLQNAMDKPVRPDGFPSWNDHFVCSGSAALTLAEGKYRYTIERGPEYGAAAGHLEVKTKEKTRLRVALPRLVDLTKEGWWSGELHVHRPLRDIELLMRAEDLHVAPVMTWWNKQNLWADQNPPAELLVNFDGDRYYHLMGGEDEREGGALLYFHLDRPLKIQSAGREHPSPMVFLEEARRHESAWIDIEKPFWWDVPIWLASGQVDSIGLANNHMCRSQMLANEAWGRPRDAQRLPPPRGNGFWTQELYYRTLDAGLHIPPSAGSASGVLPNPVGYNRVYVCLGPGQPLRYAAWWTALKAGRSFVSNGPLLRVHANGQLPGHRFAAAQGQALDIEIKAQLDTRDPVPFLEIVRNGQVEHRVPYEQWKQTGSLGQLQFRESGWFLVRAIADVPETFRFASTAPFYVEIGSGKQRISRASARFFLDWIQERSARVKVENPNERGEVLRYHRQAEAFWKARLDMATAD